MVPVSFILEHAVSKIIMFYIFDYCDIRISGSFDPGETIGADCETSEFKVSGRFLPFLLG